jgi:predicted nucleic acid-binding protein
VDAEKVLATAISVYEPNEYEVDQSLVLQAATRWRLSAYDANYVVLAEMLDAVCVTSDRQMLERVPKVTRALHSIQSG